MEHCFKLYDNSEISKLSIMECVTLIIRNGVKYTHLEVDLHQFLPTLIRITEDNLPDRTKMEAMNAVYEVAHCVSFIVSFVQER